MPIMQRSWHWLRGAAIAFMIGGWLSETVISTGLQGDITVPFACTITQVTMTAYPTGSIVVDIWKESYANLPPTNADSITASAPPTISSATKSQDSILAGWTTSISAGDTLRFNVDSVTDIVGVSISLSIKKG